MSIKNTRHNNLSNFHLTLLSMVQNRDIRESLNIESLLLRLEDCNCASTDTWHKCPRKSSQTYCCAEYPLVEALETIPELDDTIALKISVSFALAFQHSICLLSRIIEIFGGSNSSCCPSFLPRISGLKRT